MRIYKRVQLKKREIIKLQQDCEDYVWAAVDLGNFAIALGDDYLADLRDCLLVKRSSPEHVYGVGIDLSTGEIDYVAQINRRNPTVARNGLLTVEEKSGVEEVLHYFFEKLPAYHNEKITEDDDNEEEFSEAAIVFC